MAKTRTKSKTTAKKSISKSRKTSGTGETTKSSSTSAVTTEEPAPETLEQVGWLLLDAAEYQRDLASGPEVPADKWLRGSARRDLLRRSRQLADEGDPLGVAEQITDLVKQANGN